MSYCLLFLKRKSEKVTERKILLLWVASPWFVVVLVVLFCFCLFVFALLIGYMYVYNRRNGPKYLKNKIYLTTEKYLF